MATSMSTSSRRSSEDGYSPDDTGSAASESNFYVMESIEDGAYAGYDDQRRDTVIEKVLQTIGMGSRRRKGGYDYDLPLMKDAPGGLLRRHPPRELRRCRRSFVVGSTKRFLVAAPFAILMFFGVIHILYLVIGRARTFWDVEIDDDFLPHWGMHGHSGDGLASYPTDATRDVLPIPCHSHNDYWRHVPVFDAIHWGCTGIEADVWLFDEQLYVGHNLASLARNRTFKNLYVNPLVELLDKMNPVGDFSRTTGHGVFDVDPDQTLVLLIDFKTNGHDLYPVVYEQLSVLREKGYLSYWDGQNVNSRAITVVGTGNTPFDAVRQNTTYRDIFFDAPLDKLWELPRSPIATDDPIHRNDEDLAYGDAMALPAEDTSPSRQGKIGTQGVKSADAFNVTNSYYASVSFKHTVGFVWRGHLSPRQMEIIRGQIRGAKRLGLKARYWDTPRWPISLRNHVWHVLMKEGADVLNVDDLRSAAVDQWKARVHNWW